jgi:hypothetical protein
LDFGGIFLGRAFSIFSPVASGYELKNGLASPKNLLAKTSNNLLHNVLKEWPLKSVKILGAILLGRCLLPSKHPEQQVQQCRYNKRHRQRQHPCQTDISDGLALEVFYTAVRHHRARYTR